MTKIEWTDVTWNVVTGCSKVSAGCKHCYAERMWPRLRTGRPFADVKFHPERLDKPLRWRKPRMVFVNSMSDLFHPAIPFAQIDDMFSVMHEAKRHVFQILTKRPARMLEYTTKHIRNFRAWGNTNIWMGVSVEDQATADERIPLLPQTPAAVRFVSLEPMLEPVDLNFCPGCGAFPGGRHGSGVPDVDGSEIECGPIVGVPVDWVIVGAESGPKARPMQLEWAQSIAEQCKDAGVPCFTKQVHLGNDPKRLSKNPEEWPEDLRVREWPAVEEGEA